MAYYLMLNKKQINLNNVDNFKRISNLKGNSYTLEEIDNFTSMYKDQDLLKQELYKSSLISSKDLESKLYIARKNKGELEKVKYDPVFLLDKKYLDIPYLTNLILSLNEDNDFLNKLITYYRNSYVNNEIISIIRYYLIAKDMHMIDYDINELLRTFIQKEIYNYDYETGEVKVKYKSLHDLAMFTKNHITKQEEKRQEQINKKVLKKKKEVDGQISMF